MTVSNTDTLIAQMSALAAVEAAIAGIKHAYAEPPDAPPTDLPAFVNLPGASSDTWIYSDDEGAESNEGRAWECRLFVAPRGAATLGEISRRCLPFYDSVRNAFEGAQSINSTAGVLRVNYQGDNGLMFNRLTYAGQGYSGIVFRVTVTTHVRIPYAVGQ